MLFLRMPCRLIGPGFPQGTSRVKFIFYSYYLLGCGHFKNFGNKRLNGTNIVTTKTFWSKARCIQACYGNHGCLAVNAIATNDVISCEMMRGLSKESDMVDDRSSTLFVMSMHLPISVHQFLKILQMYH